MKEFIQEQRVKVANRRHPLFGRTGTVARPRIADGRAWVHMDEPAPSELRAFGDEDNRRDHKLLDPLDCDLVKDSDSANPKSEIRNPQ